MKDFCESKELFNADIHRCLIRFNLIIVPSSSLQLIMIFINHHRHLVKVGKLTLCQKQIKCYMFLVDILSSTKLSYLVCHTTWYLVGQNVHFVIFSQVFIQSDINENSYVFIQLTCLNTIGIWHKDVKCRTKTKQFDLSSSMFC